MEIVYLDSTVDDLIWLREYYQNVFPQGRKKAQRQIRLVETLPLENPYIGFATHRQDIRGFSIPGIPFSVIYRPEQNVIEVLRIWDERRNRSDSGSEIDS